MRSILYTLILLTSFTSWSQGFEGEITFKIDYISLPEEMTGFEDMLPDKMTQKISGSKIRIEQTVMGGTQVVIFDNQTNTGVVLMDIFGMKNAIETDADSIDIPTPPEYEKTTETKNILGYPCTKYLVKTEDGSQQEVWVTTQISAKLSRQNPLYGVEGYPLAYGTSEGEIVTYLEVIKIEEKVIPASEFETPEDYTIMTQEELDAFSGN